MDQFELGFRMGSVMTKLEGFEPPEMDHESLDSTYDIVDGGWGEWEGRWVEMGCTKVGSPSHPFPSAATSPKPHESLTPTILYISEHLMRKSGQLLSPHT